MLKTTYAQVFRAKGKVLKGEWDGEKFTVSLSDSRSVRSYTTKDESRGRAKWYEWGEPLGVRVEDED